MNTCNVNKFIHTRYARIMTVTDLDMVMHKKSKNHIRIVECKYPTEAENQSQDDVLKELANMLDFAIKNGYRNNKGVPKVEVLKLICTPKKIGEQSKYNNEIQEVYDINSFVTKSFIDGSEKIYKTKKEIDEFFLMESNVNKKYNPTYESHYPKQLELWI